MAVLKYILESKATPTPSRFQLMLGGGALEARQESVSVWPACSSRGSSLETELKPEPVPAGRSINTGIARKERGRHVRRKSTSIAREAVWLVRVVIKRS